MLVVVFLAGFNVWESQLDLTTAALSERDAARAERDVAKATADEREKTISRQQEQIADLQSKLVLGGANAKPIQPAATFKKYVCATQISPITAGHYAELFEFGVTGGSSNGLAAAIKISEPIASTRHWGASPLRTDIPANTASVETMVSDAVDGSLYHLSFASPSVLPERSQYVYVEAEKPFQIQGVLFLENFDAISDQMKANAMAINYGTCPR